MELIIIGILLIIIAILGVKYKQIKSLLMDENHNKMVVFLSEISSMHGIDWNGQKDIDDVLNQLKRKLTSSGYGSKY